MWRFKPQILEIWAISHSLAEQSEEGQAAVKQNLVVTAADPNKISFMLRDTSPNL